MAAPARTRVIVRAQPVNCQANPSMVCRAPAKVNLTLAVLGRRPDGFHELESWVVKLDWADELTFESAEGFHLTVDPPFQDVPSDESNIVWQAAAALARVSGRAMTGRVDLDKRIPAGAGLGGGSSDAAATLLGLNRLWGLNWPIERLMAVAGQVGSDVSVFLRTGSAMIRGRGECVEPLPAAWKGWLALVVPPYPVRTAAVYARWSPPRPARSAGDAALWGCLPCAAEVLSERLFNDLAEAAFACEPRLARLHSILEGLDGQRVHLTGSGSCLFAVFDTRAGAEAWASKAASRLRDGERVHVVETL